MNKNGVCDSALLTRFYHRMAAVMNETGEDSTVVYSLKSIENARRLNDLYSEAISFNELGYYYKNRRKIDTSMQCYLQAESKWKQYGSYTNAAHAMYNSALLIAHNNLSRKKSNTILKEIIKMQQANIINYQMDNVYDAIRDNYFFLGDSINFFKYKILALEVRMNANVNRHEADIRKITEKYKNDSIKAEMNSVSEKLEISEDNLKAKNTENKLAYAFLSILALLLLLIAFLLYRIFISNKVLKEKFKEKEALVQEIHHRVKNNLQFVNSIINMQTNTASSESEENVLKDISRRIRSMALVHEMLYNKNNEEGVSIKNYLSELIKSIKDLSINLDKKVEFDLEVEDLNFDTPKATAIGMIVSELVSNSLKYAFSNTEKPRIKILLYQKSELEYEYIYNDNGKGLPQNYIKANKLGMRLIDIFSRQINGTYSFENNEGLTYKLIFSKRIKK
jgi:two-component sensor histidine kinase